MVPSLDAHRYLKGSVELRSWDLGWRSLVIDEIAGTPCATEHTTAATSDHFISLVTAGSCEMESWRGGKWQRARYRPGSIGFRPSDHAGTLRWMSDTPHVTLQLYLPRSFVDDAANGLARRPGEVELRPMLNVEDPLVAATMQALKEGLIAGAPDLYAETAGQFLAAHFLQRYAGQRLATIAGREDQRLRRADDYLRAFLSEPISLTALAREAGLSRFHLLRLFKAAYGETPLKRLTRLRIEQARRLLSETRRPAIEIGIACGYDNPANFAAAFRRQVGVSPSAFRREREVVEP